MSTDTSTDIVAALDATDPNLQDATADERVQTDTEVDADESVEGEEELGDKGKQALDRMKAKLQAERAARRAAEAKLNESSAADDPDRIQREANARAVAKANDRILRAEVRAAATGKLSDPSDALTFIDMTQFDVDDDGEVDQEEIAQAITDLIAKKPYLAAQGGPKSLKPDPSQGEGGRGTATTADRFAQAIDGLI
ncbi:hypothetical protein [Cellulomonas denverensis]|uniref:EF-hand domain-containing protein n=1 Tax=Cellulomonas denverensis TaxID=264297 RepID=A0A7X6KUF4_9CELL|nr:hypothetical protein [Cellulomonas denverensis]NKY22213.1 hypothetical protein [Cellulomonas denverensis]GIG27179.1 hypothetical protein Cde04nite_34230 [Cellulomonas denverensis]